MSTRKLYFINDGQRHEIVVTNLTAALASLDNARHYLGDPSRAKFYADILPQLETIKFKDGDKRSWVTVASMDRLIESKRKSAAKHD
jgi:hypothetical protein